VSRSDRNDVRDPVSGPPLPAEDRRQPAGRQLPAPSRVLAAGVLAAAASVGLCVLLVRAATALTPTLAGYSHFRFGDYAPLAVGGVAVATLAWPAVALLSPTPVRLYRSLAVAVSLVAFLPDLGLLAEGEPARAVAFLAAMHVAVAVVTFAAVVTLAPVPRPVTAPATGSPEPPPQPGREAGAGALTDRRSGRAGKGSPGETSAAPEAAEAGWGSGLAAVLDPLGRTLWLALVATVGLVTALGVVALVTVPTTRPAVLVPVAGRFVYLLHALLGGVLAIAGAVVLLLSRERGDALVRRSAVSGLVGVVLAAGGGLLTVLPAERVLGIVVMLAGALLAGFAYLAPIALAEEGPAGGARPVGPAGGEQALATCVRCVERAAAAEGDRDPARSRDDWIIDRVETGDCPLCPGTRLRVTGTVGACPCCRSTYRRLPGGDDRSWIITPGSRTLAGGARSGR